MKRRNIFSESPSLGNGLILLLGTPSITAVRVGHGGRRGMEEGEAEGPRARFRRTLPEWSIAREVRTAPLTSAALRSHPPRPAPHKGCPLITKAKIPFPSRPTKPRTGNAKAPALDPDDYRDEVLSEIDPRSLAQARDALIVQTDRLHRLRSEKDEAVAETTRIDAELQQTRAQWKKAVDAHDEATAAMRDVQRELDDAKEALRRALTRRDADAAEMEERDLR